MSAKASDFLKDLHDENKFVRVGGVTIFDEHEETYYVDAKGRPCDSRKPGAKKKVRRFSKKRLEEIARACNERDRTGSLSPLAFGHTIPDEDDETKQPPPVGYAHKYRVAYSDQHKRHVLKTDFFIAREKYAEAKTYPRVSIELWDKHSIVDPIALLRRTPQRDLGQWIYGRSGEEILRYSMEFNMPERFEMEDDDLAVQNEMPQEEPLPEPPKADEGEMSDEEHDEYMRHCYSHPLAAKHFARCHKRYGMAEEVKDEADPTGPPSADVEPERNAAFLSGTNSGLPVAAKKHSRDDGLERFRRGGDQLLYKRIEELETREARKEAENWVLRLSDQEGFEMDEPVEVERFARLYRDGGSEACEKHAEHIRRFHRPKVTHSTGPISNQDRPARTPSGYDPDNPETMPLEDQEKVLHYQRQHRLWDMPWHELAARALPRRYGNTKK